MAAPWPEGTARDDPAAWHGFIAKAWASAALASAVELASPSLAAAIGEILSGGVPDRKKATRAGMALARYLVRLRGRATPFGLFAGVAPAPVGDPAAATWGEEHRLGARADARWLASLVTALEADGQLRRRLRVTASDLLTVRGNRIIVGWLPQASALAQDQPAEISLRRTPAAEAALRLARAPIAVGELAERIAAEFAPATTGQAEEMISQLMAYGALVSSVRPPSTAPDGLGWVLDALSAVGVGGQPGCERTAALREAHARLCSAAPAGLGAIAARMRELAGAPAHPVAVDLHAGCHVTILAARGGRGSGGGVRPGAAEPASARRQRVEGLPRPVPGPLRHGHRCPGHGPPRPGDRAGTAGPLRRPAACRPLRPGRAAGRAGPAGCPGRGGRSRPRRRAHRRRSPGQNPPRPGRSRTWTSRSTSAPPALGGTQRGRVHDRRLRHRPHRDGHLRPVPAPAGRRRARAAGRAVRGLPAVTRGALAAQLSFPPHHPRAENVTRVPRMLPYLLSIGEYHGQDDPARIPLDDLAVTARPDRFYLISLSRRVPVEPVLACAPAWHAVPPVARLLFELPRAHCPPAAVFDWGAAASMPFLPRLRLGRAILAPARWRIPASAPARPAGQRRRVDGGPGGAAGAGCACPPGCRSGPVTGSCG